MVNKNPEQKARDPIDLQLKQAGWTVQDKKETDFNAGPGIAIREYQTDAGPADYVLPVNKRAVGVIEAKPEDWGQKITSVEGQSQGYAATTLKWVNRKTPLRFVYESTGVITRFTDGCNPKPCSRELFNNESEKKYPLRATGFRYLPAAGVRWLKNPKKEQEKERPYKNTRR